MHIGALTYERVLNKIQNLQRRRMQVPWELWYQLGHLDDERISEAEFQRGQKGGSTDVGNRQAKKAG